MDRVKLCGQVTFPHRLDVAPYLSAMGDEVGEENIRTFEDVKRERNTCVANVVGIFVRLGSLNQCRPPFLADQFWLPSPTTFATMHWRQSLSHTSWSHFDPFTSQRWQRDGPIPG